MLTLTQHPFKIVQHRVILLASCLLCCLMFSTLSQPAGYCLNCVRTNDHTLLESPEYGNEQLGASGGASNCVPNIGEQQDSNELAVELFLHTAHQQPEGNLVISPHSLFSGIAYSDAGSRWSNFAIAAATSGVSG